MKKLPKICAFVLFMFAWVFSLYEGNHILGMMNAGLMWMILGFRHERD